jgi:hypothetical protein
VNRHMLLIALVVWAIGLFGAVGTIKAASHDVAWTFGNVGSRSYRLDAFEPDDAGLGANIGTEDPTLSCRLLSGQCLCNIEEYVGSYLGVLFVLI